MVQQTPFKKLTTALSDVGLGLSLTKKYLIYYAYWKICNGRPATLNNETQTSFWRIMVYISKKVFGPKEEDQTA